MKKIHMGDKNKIKKNDNKMFKKEEYKISFKSNEF